MNYFKSSIALRSFDYFLMTYGRLGLISSQTDSNAYQLARYFNELAQQIDDAGSTDSTTQ